MLVLQASLQFLATLRCSLFAGLRSASIEWSTPHEGFAAWRLLPRLSPDL